MNTDLAKDQGHFSEPPLDDMREELDGILRDEGLLAPGRPHLRRLTLACAVISEALRRRGMIATLVGGGAIEFYAPGTYATDDADLVVQSVSGVVDRRRLHDVFSALRFESSGRHWVRDGFFVEVPGTYLEDPFSEYPVGPYALRVVEKEVVLVGRLVEFDQTGHTGQGSQAVAMLRTFAGELDHSLLAKLLRRERSERVYEVLWGLAASDQAMTDELLRDVWDGLRGRKPQRDAGHEQEED
ncbi:MAG TPA: hypothetical protein VHG51_02170 [Longimicrobiaceae bacterium]|nr:hypothetical protein [Longimicrobiaceae bacterium]